jgi:hypothetical protein
MHICRMLSVPRKGKLTARRDAKPTGLSGMGGSRAAEGRLIGRGQVQLRSPMLDGSARAVRAKKGRPRMLRRNDESGEVRPTWEEPEASFSDLGEVRITRARAIKLAGAAIAGSALSLLWAGEADARKKKRRRRRRRRKAQVNTPTPVTLAPGDNTISITNPSPDKPLTISGVKVIDSDGSVVDSNVLTDPVTIAPGDTADLTVNLDANDLLNADRLRLIDGRGVPITVVDENGITLGDIDVL